MDPVSLAALGMAGNIVQFVDFGCKLVSKARKIHKDGCDKEYIDLKVVINDLARSSDSLRNDLDSRQKVNGMLADDDAALQEICSGCLHVAWEIQNALENLSPKGASTKWKSVRQALKSLWGNEHLAEMKRTLEMYQSQMDSHILVSLRKRFDIASLSQKEQFENLSGGIQAAVQRTKQLELRLSQQSQSLGDNDAEILEAVTKWGSSNREEHERTREAVMETTSNLQEASAASHQETLQQVASLGLQVTGAVKVASDASERQHEATIAEIELIRAATEQQVKELREEIRQLKIEIEQSVQKVVSSVGKVSASEQRRLKETSNAKFNVWVAKELVLKNLLEILKIFKSQIGDWVAAFESATWKMQPYPTIKSAPKRGQVHTDLELASLWLGKPLDPDGDTGHNVINNEALRSLRDQSLIDPISCFNLESAEFFEHVVGRCQSGNHYRAAEILLSTGIKPTYKTLISALRWNKESVILIGGALFVRGRRYKPNHGRFRQLVRRCDDRDMAELVHLLSVCPEFMQQQIMGVLPLTAAARSGNWAAVAILTIFGASPIDPENISNSPLVVAVEEWNLGMARVMIEHHPSPLESGWEWHVLQKLAKKNFAGPWGDIECIIGKITILHGLRLAVENRHERLISFMLWRFKVEGRVHGETGSSEVLEMAMDSGICREFAAYIKGFTTKPVPDTPKPPTSALVTSPTSTPKLVTPAPPTVPPGGWATELEGLKFT